jgi:hypothetical protein
LLPACGHVGNALALSTCPQGTGAPGDRWIFDSTDAAEFVSMPTDGRSDMSVNSENSKRRGCRPACADAADCRMFLCARCRCQVLVCRHCDRGHIYCFGICAQAARRERQKEARRRYQATPRGRSMHAQRNRRYRARQCRVTDQGLTKVQSERHSQGREVAAAPPPNTSPPKKGLCHRCGGQTSQFWRLSPLRPRRRRVPGSPKQRIRSLPRPRVQVGFRQNCADSRSH